MIGPSLPDLWRAETVKLFSRLSARAGLVLAMLIGIAGPLFMRLASGSQVTVNGQNVAETMDLSMVAGLDWSLWFRNAYLMRVVIVLLVAGAIASELQSRSLREDLLRAVPRWKILVAKWLAVVAWIAASAATTWLACSLLGVVVLEWGGDWGRLASGYAATVLTDCGFAALTVLIAILVRRVGATIVIAVLTEALNLFLTFALFVLQQASLAFDLPAVATSIVAARPWLPPSAFTAYGGYLEGTDWQWESFVALALITAASLALAAWRFERMDVH